MNRTAANPEARWPRGGLFMTAEAWFRETRGVGIYLERACLVCSFRALSPLEYFA